MTKFYHLHEQIQFAIAFASMHGALDSTTSQVGISISQYAKLLESIQLKTLRWFVHDSTSTNLPVTCLKNDHQAKHYTTMMN